jgi:hypothetical protein
MKKIDVSESVMKKVTRFEKSRSQTWLRIFYTTVYALLALFGVFLWRVWQTISDLQGWDLLTIFTQDREIIRDYWQDTVMTFIEELPIETMYLAVGILITLIIVIYITRKRRKVYEYRMRQLAKLQDLRKNSK